MKSGISILIQLVAAYILALPIMFYGVHGLSHTHKNDCEHHTDYTVDGETFISLTEEDCSLCDLYEDYNSFIENYDYNSIGDTTVVINIATQLSIPNLKKPYLHLRDPPNVISFLKYI